MTSIKCSEIKIGRLGGALLTQTTFPRAYYRYYGGMCESITYEEAEEMMKDKEFKYL